MLTINTLEKLECCLSDVFCYFLTCFAPFSSVSNIDFEQVDICWLVLILILQFSKVLIVWLFSVNYPQSVKLDQRRNANIWVWIIHLLAHLMPLVSFYTPLVSRDIERDQ